MKDWSERDTEDVEASEDGLEDTICDEETLVVNVGESGVLFLVETLVIAVYLSIVSMVVVEHGREGIETLPLVDDKLEYCDDGELSPGSVSRLARLQVLVVFNFIEEGVWLPMLLVKVVVLVETFTNLVFLYFNSFSALDFSILL